MANEKNSKGQVLPPQLTKERAEDLILYARESRGIDISELVYAYLDDQESYE